MDIRYIYFEKHSIKGFNPEEETIENENALIFSPKTSNDGMFGSANVTEIFGHPEKTYKIVYQFWVDIKKYRESGKKYLDDDILNVLIKLNDKNAGI